MSNNTKHSKHIPKKVLGMLALSISALFASSALAVSAGGGTQYSFDCVTIGTGAGWLIKNTDGTYRLGIGVSGEYTTFKWKRVASPTSYSGKIDLSEIKFNRTNFPSCSATVNGTNLILYEETLRGFSSCTSGSTSYRGTCTW